MPDVGRFGLLGCLVALKPEEVFPVELVVGIPRFLDEGRTPECLLLGLD